MWTWRPGRWETEGKPQIGLFAMRWERSSSGHRGWERTFCTTSFQDWSWLDMAMPPEVRHLFAILIHCLQCMWSFASSKHLFGSQKNTKNIGRQKVRQNKTCKCNSREKGYIGDPRKGIEFREYRDTRQLWSYLTKTLKWSSKNVNYISFVIRSGDNKCKWGIAFLDHSFPGFEFESCYTFLMERDKVARKLNFEFSKLRPCPIFEWMLLIFANFARIWRHSDSQSLRGSFRTNTLNMTHGCSGQKYRKQIYTFLYLLAVSVSFCQIPFINVFL